MASWILLAIGAQLLSAVVIFVDRYMLTHRKGMGHPVVYAFYVALLSGIVVVLVPFGVVSAPNLIIVKISCIIAALFITALLFLYTALKEGHASDVMPVVAAFSAVTSFVCASLFLDEHLPAHFLIAVTLFIAGTFLISRLRFTYRSLFLVACAGFLFGLSTFLIKFIFEETTFWDGFFWTRMANVIGAVILLVWPGNWKTIMHGTRSSSTGTRWIVVGNKALAGLANALSFFAISLGSVSVVNSLGGLQFAFLPVIAFLFAGYFPNVLRSEIFHDKSHHKILGIALIVVGFAALAWS